MLPCTPIRTPLSFFFNKRFMLNPLYTIQLSLWTTFLIFFFSLWTLFFIPFFSRSNSRCNHDLFLNILLILPLLSALPCGKRGSKVKHKGNMAAGRGVFNVYFLYFRLCPPFSPFCFLALPVMISLVSPSLVHSKIVQEKTNLPLPLIG